MKTERIPEMLLFDAQKHSDCTIHEREEKYRFLIEHIHDIVYTITIDGMFTFVSPVWTELLGHNVDQVVGRSFTEFVHPDDLPACFIWLEKIAVTKQRQEGIEYRVQHLDGTWFWHTSNAVPFSGADNTIAGYYGLAADITERKLAREEKIIREQQKILAQHIEKARNSERESISRDLHDDLGQSLSAIIVYLGLIKPKISDNDTLTKINKLTALAQEAISSVKRIMVKLGPEILDELGLEAAIRWYAKEFADRNRVEMNLMLNPGLVIPNDYSNSIFRIIQESLTNISRHARATRVFISLYSLDEHIMLRISDNGIGINKNGIESKTSWGIISMKERAHSLDGTFEIYSDAGNGTVIKIDIPLKRS